MVSTIISILSIFVIMVVVTQGFVRINTNRVPRVKPVSENFFLDIAEDPAINTPKQIFGEVAYKSFVDEYDPNSLINGRTNYDIIKRVRELKLLSLAADSGLIEALEAKGLTLSKAEKLLPLVESYLPQIVKNKDALINLAPLIIEPAPSLLPLAVSILRTSPSTFSFSGFALIGTGIYESFDNLVLGIVLSILGFPLAILGTILSGSIPLPEPSIDTSRDNLLLSSDKSTSPTSAIINKDVSRKGPSTSATLAVGKNSSSNKNGARKVIKINGP